MLAGGLARVDEWVVNCMFFREESLLVQHFIVLLLEHEPLHY